MDAPLQLNRELCLCYTVDLATTDSCVKGLKDVNTQRVLFLISAAGVHIKRNPFFSVAHLPFFGPRPPLCHGFETIQFLCGEDFSLAPNPHHGGPGYLPVFVRHFTQHVSGTDGPTRN